MDADTPADWLERSASGSSDRAALVLREGVVTHEQLLDLVVARARSLVGDAAPGQIQPMPVRLDLASIVELLALNSLGAVPLPYIGTFPDRVMAQSVGAVLCVATTGTSGSQKIVPLTMANIGASVEASRARLGTDANDTWLLCLPLNHIGGLSVLYRMLEAGGTVIVEPFGAGLTDVIRAASPTIVSLVPTMIHRIVATDPAALASVGTVLTGGAPLGDALLESCRIEGIDLVPTYGMTEASSQIATAVPGEPVPYAGFVGMPLDGVSVAIEADEGSETGRIVVDGRSVFDGYLGEVRREGPFRTGDVGTMDDTGNLTILGRADDVVVSGGENVSLAVVADLVRNDPGVVDAVIVAIPSEEWGSELCAMIVTERSIAAVQDRLAAVLSPHQIPRRWIRVPEIPLMPNGKVDQLSIQRAFA